MFSHPFNEASGEESSALCVAIAPASSRSTMPLNFGMTKQLGVRQSPPIKAMGTKTGTVGHSPELPLHGQGKAEHFRNLWDFQKFQTHLRLVVNNLLCLGRMSCIFQHFQVLKYNVSDKYMLLSCF